MKTAKLLPAILLASLLCAIGASAQSRPESIPTPYDEVDEKIYQTKGKNMRLYVAPDPLYSPSALNTESKWRWEIGSTWGSGTLRKDWTNENWVEVAPTADMTIQVKERFGAAGCESSSPTTKQIVAVDAPFFSSFGVENASEWIVEANNYTKCQNTPDATVSISLVGLTEAGLDATELMQYGLTYTVACQTADNTGLFGSANVEQSVTSDILKSVPFTINIPMKTNSGGVVVPTRYTIVFMKETLQSKISRLSDKREHLVTNNDLSGISYTSYPSPGVTLVFNLNPIPTTGPIYHIPNNF